MQPLRRYCPPASFVEAARELRRFGESSDGAALAQEGMRAFPTLVRAAEEAAELFRDSFERGGDMRLMMTFGDQAIAWRLSAYWAGMACEPICAHDGVHLAVLGPRRRACRGCADRLRDGADDGRCDLCGGATDRFEPFMVQLADLIVAGDQCLACSKFNRSVRAGLG
jgi:hypothetical protein